MKNEDANAPFVVPVSFGDNGTIYGCGHALDTFLYAFDLSTEDSMCEWESDARREAADQTINAWDWNATVRDTLNAGISVELWHELAPTANGLDMQTRANASDYLLGDFLKIEEGNIFSCIVKNYREKIDGLIQDNPGKPIIEGVPREISKAVAKAEEWAAENCQNEWLNGDRSNEGVLDQLSRKLTGKSGNVEWITKTDTIYITFTANQVRDWYAYDLGDDKAIPSIQEIAKYTKSVILNRCAGEYERKKAAVREWVAKRKAHNERQAAQNEKMKAEARARKQQVKK